MKTSDSLLPVCRQWGRLRRQLRRRRGQRTYRRRFRRVFFEPLELRIPLAFDFGDAPDTASGVATGNYRTLATDNGPSHFVLPGLLMGVGIDGEIEARSNVWANGDDIDQASPDDEDGLVNTTNDLTVTLGGSPSVRVRVTNTTGRTANLYGWIDYDQDGEFENDTERASITVPDGTNNEIVILMFPPIPLTAVAESTYARFRLSTDIAASESTGTATDGEVEDYSAQLVMPSSGLEYEARRILIAHETNGGPTVPGSASFGSSVASLGDLDGDGVPDVVVGSTGGGPGTVDGAVFVLFMNANGTVKSSQQIASGIGGGPELMDRDFFGASVASLGDLDGDGVVDIAVGAPGDDTGGNYFGAIHILFLKPDGTVKKRGTIASGMNGSPPLLEFDSFGSSLAAIGDLDGDGIPDLAVGTSGDDTAGRAQGAAYVLFLNADGSPKSSAKIARGIAGGPSTADFDEFGSAVSAVGDLDGDGITDLVVGADRDNTGGKDRGAVYILFMESDGSVKNHQKIASGVGGGPALVDDSYFGSSVARLGDLDGDGFQDLAVGTGRQRELHILFMNGDGTAKATTKLSGAGGFFGNAATTLGDLDGDGVTDLVVAAYRDNTNGNFAGAINVIFLRPIDTTPPLLLEFARHNPSEMITNVDSLTFRVTFSEAIGSILPSDFEVDGLPTASVTRIDAVTRREFDATVSGNDVANFTGSLGLNLSDHHGITDVTGIRLSNGEPPIDETYALVNVNFDFGDAPDTGVGTGFANYNTLSNDNGARHTIVRGLHLGTAVNGEVEALPNQTATGDDVDQGIPDDEDGVSDPVADLAFTVGAVPTVRLRATNTTGTDATLYGWIDYNQDGKFDNATERATSVVPNDTVNGIIALIFPTVPITAATGKTYARFRLTTDAAMSDPTGPASDGEVEDYVAMITLPADAVVDDSKAKKIADDTNGAPSLEGIENFGDAIAALGDLNGDGIVDMAVGVPENNQFGEQLGGVYVFFMNRDGTVASHQLIATGLDSGTNQQNFYRFGTSIAVVNDLNGDGIAELAVGAIGDDTGGPDRGAVYILFMSPDGTVQGQRKIADKTNGGPALNDFDFFGSALTSIGDLDGDGVADLVVGAESDNTGGTSRGALYILFLTPTGSVKSYQKIASGSTNAPVLQDFDGFGRAVASLGDIDGDGVSDLAVGTRGDDTGGINSGAIYVLFLRSDGTAKGSTKIASELHGGPQLVAGDRFGSAVAAVGDLDRNGVTDLAVGATGDDTQGPGRGAVYLLYLNIDGTAEASTKIADGVAGGPELANLDAFGSSIASLGDLDSDGVTDLAIGAAFDDTGGPNLGAVHVLFLKPLDTASPSLLSFTRHRPLTSSTSNNSLIFRAAFSEPVKNVDSSDFVIRSTTAAIVTAVSAVSDSVYEVAVSGGAVVQFNGSIGLGLSTEQDIVDLAGNAIPNNAPPIDEEYLLVNAGTDFGDAPDAESGVGAGNYQTRLADNGPRHAIVPGLLMGENIDGESDAAPNANANGDDLAQGQPEDEDGLIDSLTDLMLKLGVAPTVRVRVTNTIGKEAMLYGWIDYDLDGAFENESERAQVAVPDGTENSVVTLNFPEFSVPTPYGRTYARFRLSTDMAAAESIGDAADGEVEDYAVTIAQPGDGTVNPNHSKRIADGFNGGPTLPHDSRFGSSLASLGDLDGDGVGDIAVGAIFGNADDGGGGAVFVLFLNSDGTVKATTKIASEIGGGPAFANGDLFGRSLAALGDLDGDGVPDLAVGASSDDGDHLYSHRGAVYMLFMSSDGTVKDSQKIASGVGGGPSLATGDQFGTSLAAIADLDGDGVVDLAVGAERDDTDGFDAGAVHILFMNSNGTVKRSQKLSGEIGEAPTLANGDYFGSAIASLGDVDGDGVIDLAVGARGDHPGAAYVLLLHPDATVKSKVKIQSGADLFDREFGSSLASLGDLDGDGIPDLAVGDALDRTGGRYRGAVHVLLLNSDGSAKSSTKIASDTGGGSTLADFGFFGSSVAVLGDLNGDGVPELAVGARGPDGSGDDLDHGAVEILFLNPILDFGDAPTASQLGITNSYPTTVAEDGARHVIGDLFLGQLVDSEPDGQPDSAAGQAATGGDDNAGAADEDGVFAISSMIASNTVATISSYAVIASRTGFLDAWIDFNQDGDWDDAGEQIFTSTDVVAGVNLLSFNVPAGATPGTTFARFRLSSAGGLAPTGPAPDGEVEDYIVRILDGDAAEGAAVEVDASVSGTLDVIADGDDVVVRSGAIELFRAPGAALNRINVVGTEGDDTLNVANLDGIFAGLVGGNAGPGYDTLRLTGDGQELDLTQIADSGIQGLETIDITGSGANTLTLNVAEVLNISPTTDVLRVRHDADDTVSYGGGWNAELPRIIDDQFVHVLTQGDATVQVVNPFAFHNPLRALDTNRDGSISPVDALIVINKINDGGSGVLPTPISLAGIAEFFYYDTNKDGSIAPVDVLVVINFLNDPARNGEGESGTARLAAAMIPNPVALPSAHLAVLAPSRPPPPAPRLLASRDDRTDYNTVQNREANTIQSSDRIPRIARYSAMIDELFGDDELSVLRPFFN